jgi:hypothetical protein
MYLPYIGFFNKIRNADFFVIGDDFHYSKGYFYNRNKIKTSAGELMLTVPLQKNSFSQDINKVLISNNKDWAKNHFQNIELYYRKAAHFDEYIDFFEKIYSRRWDTLYELNMATLGYFLEQLDINIPVYFTSSLLKNYTFVNKTQKLVDICKIFDSDTYLSGISGKDYLKNKIFEENKITLEYQNYSPREYKQLWGQFIPNLSIIDLLFNLGEEAREIIK